MKPKFLAIATCLLFASCSNSQNGKLSATNQEPVNTSATFHILSAAFKDGDTIPAIYTCDSTNISPQLHWNNPFNNTKSFALIVDDPDAPMAPWVHWVLYNIPESDTMLNTNTTKDTAFSNGTEQGRTSFGGVGYGGPCPPDGVHHYHFKLYALDEKVLFPAGLSKNKLMEAMKGHILAETELVGLYKKKKRN